MLEHIPNHIKNIFISGPHIKGLRLNHDYLYEKYYSGSRFWINHDNKIIKVPDFNVYRNFYKEFGWKF